MFFIYSLIFLLLIIVIIPMTYAQGIILCGGVLCSERGYNDGYNNGFEGAAATPNPFYNQIPSYEKGYQKGYIDGAHDRFVMESPPSSPTPHSNKIPENGGTGDPIILCIPPTCTQIRTVTIHPDTAESDQEYFRLNSMCMVQQDRKYVEGQMFFMDMNYDGVLSNGMEMGYNPHSDITPYEYFSTPHFDFNQNGMIDRYDTYWHQAKVLDTATGEIYHPSHFGIVSINLEYFIIPDDYVGNGAYLNGVDGYEHDWRYDQERATGWEPLHYADYNIRAGSASPHGVVFEDGSTIPSFGALMGYRGETSDCC